MRFSLIVPTLGRTTELSRLLDSLLGQTFRRFEVIIVDQNPDDRLSPVICDYQNAFFPIRHIRTEKRGAARARNLGIPHASGQILTFPDDDCWYAPHVLQEMDIVFRDNPRWDVISIPARDPALDKPSLLGWQTGSVLVDRENIWGLIIEATSFHRRRALEAVGGFDATLGVGSGTAWGSGEGTDLVLRMLARGFRVQYHPVVCVFHRDQSRDAHNERKAYNYGVGMGRVLKIHQYPLLQVAQYIMRPFLGVLFYTLTAHRSAARYAWSMALGRWRGWRDLAPYQPELLTEENAL
jgi:glycosyltransferase involved in cell wall biosynthesis